jgi:hypothetical protein
LISTLGAPDETPSPAKKSRKSVFHLGQTDDAVAVDAGWTWWWCGDEIC